MDLRKRVGALIRSKSESMFGLLEQMVNTDSGTHDKEGVNRVAEMIVRRLGSCGAIIERYPQEKFGDHIVARIKGDRQEGSRVLLVGHMDTVFEKGTARKRPFTVDGNRVYGPGVHDMKSGLVSAMEASIALVEAGFRDFAEITLVFNSDEEVGSPTSRSLIEEAARQSHCAFVLECAYPDGSVVTARKGVGMYVLRVQGISAHAGAEPEKGASAVVEIAHKIVGIHGLNHITLGTTLNAGVVKGGTRRNVVAESAEAEIDLRVVTEEEAQRVETALHQIAAETHIPGTTTELTGGLNRPPMERTMRVAELYEKVRREASRLGLMVGERSTGGASDGNFVGYLGTPIVDGMGPQGGFAHSLDEYMQLDTFVPWVELLAASMISACVG